MRTNAKTLSWVALILLSVWVIAVSVVLVTHDHDETSCWEDEVVMWDGDEHTQCVPLDNLLER